MSWESRKWFVVGDSLSDDTLGGTNGNPKYYAHISSLTGISVIKTVKGGTGYWAGKNSNIAFYQRIKNVGADNDVDIVTVFGSVNDWKFYKGISKRDEANYNIPTIGIDLNGNEYTFAAYVRAHGDSLNIPISFFEQNLVLTDTESNTSGLTYGMSMVAYINEVINLCHQKFPKAKVVLVDEIYFRGTAGVRFDTQLIAVRNLKKAIVNYRASHGDSWLSLVELEKSVYDGLDVPERLYVNTISGEGLSFYQIENDTFRAYYAYDTNGHPNTLYHRIWLSPVFAHIISEATGSVITDSSLMMTEGEKQDLDRLWINKPSMTPTTYTATFVADGVTVDTVEFESGASVLPRVPAVPAKTGYTGAWEPYTVSDADITINAVYTANTYSVTFKADGVTVAVVPYQYGSQSITEPAVPSKEGYTGVWSPYTLGAQDSVSQAVYAPIAWEPTGYALGPNGPVMEGIKPSGLKAYEGMTPAGVVQFRTY